MNEFTIKAKGKELSYPILSDFIKVLEALMMIGEEVIVVFAKKATGALEQINDLLKKHGVKLSITTQSDPRLSDYIVSGLVGTVAGAAMGAGAGLAIDLVMQAATFPIGTLVGAAAGGVIGGTAGIACTYWGLTVRFDVINPELIEIKLTPNGEPPSTASR